MKLVRQKIYAKYNANQVVANGENCNLNKKASTHILQALHYKLLEAKRRLLSDFFYFSKHKIIIKSKSKNSHQCLPISMAKTLK